MINKRRMLTASLVAIMMATLTTAFIYILLVVMSFFAIMPSAAQSIIWVGSMLALIFGGTFVLAFRKLLAAFTE